MAVGDSILGLVGGLAVVALLVGAFAAVRGAKGRPNFTFNVMPSGTAGEKAAAAGGSRQLNGASGGSKAVKTKQVLKSRTSNARTTLFPGARRPSDLTLVRPGGE